MEHICDININLTHRSILQFVLAFSLALVSCSEAGKYGKYGGGYEAPPSNINAAVISKHYFKVKNVPSSSQQADIPTIVISSGSTPLKIQMESSSSDVEVTQSHSNAAPQMQTSNSVDGAIVLKHFVRKPIIQKVREIIVPQRNIVQEVMPVKEFIKTIVSQEQATSAPDTGSNGKYY